MEAAGIIYGDLLERRGISHPGARLTLPFTPGCEVVGVIEAIGSEVSAADGLEIGQCVLALMENGGYASYAYPEAWHCIPLPDGVDSAKAVALPVNYWTTYYALHNAASIQSGQRLLIHGGAGGIGTAALQLGKLAGCTLYATASVPKHDLIRSLGAVPIDYRAEDFVQRIRELTGDGVDAVVETIGGTNMARSYQSLRSPGTLLIVGSLSSEGSVFSSMLGPMLGLVPRAFKSWQAPEADHDESELAEG